jgi:hypothetical protein
MYSGTITSTSIRQEIFFSSMPPGKKLRREQFTHFCETKQKRQVLHIFYFGKMHSKLVTGAAVLAAACIAPSDAFSTGSIPSLRSGNGISSLQV